MASLCSTERGAWSRTARSSLRSTPSVFERALRQVELKLESARLQLRAKELDLDEVAEARLQSAVARAEAADLAVSSAHDDVTAALANVRLAQATLDNNLELLPSGAVSDIAVKQAETELESSQTQLEAGQDSRDDEGA